MRPGLVAVAAGIMVAAAMEARAVTVTWNTCGSGTSSTVCDHGLTGSPRTGGGNDPFTFTGTGGRLLVTEAFEVASPVSSAPLNSIYGGGLGAGGENNPEHSVDNTNLSGNELIVFRFPENAYVPVSFRLGYVDNDGDTQTWIGGIDGDPFSDALILFNSGTYEWGVFGGGVDADALTSRGYIQQNFNTSSAGEPQTFTFSNGAAGRYLIIAAPTGMDEDDRFKIQQIVANTPNNQMPEPGTVVLVGAGLAVLALRRKKQ